MQIAQTGAGYMTDSFFINFHKVLVLPIVLGLMWWFGNVSIEMCVYFALHGTYALLWLIKQRCYPDKRFDVRRPIWIGVLFVFVPLAGYYVAPYLVASRHVSLSAPLIAGTISLFTFGIFFHFVSDAQKYYTLCSKPSLITDGLFSQIRNPNYLGEIMIYCAFAVLSAHWLPFLIVAVWAAAFFIPGARAKDVELAKYPSYAGYRARTAAIIPYVW